jgi:hypothetical protein
MKIGLVKVVLTGKSVGTELVGHMVLAPSDIWLPFNQVAVGIEDEEVRDTSTVIIGNIVLEQTCDHAVVLR